jgi:Fe-S cluster biogenesis protein NfuA/nitrite reductase/ring-hydroxylating ferredoxin subunit
VEFDQAVAELDLLVDTLERDGDERALMLLQLMDAVHRPALELILAGQLGHPVAYAVLSMYDLAPLEEHLQVEEALDEIRPYIESHGGGLDLLDVEADTGIVHVRMHGSCHGCAGSAITLRRGVEEKLRERLDWFTEVVAHDPEEDPEAPAPENGIAARLLQIEHFNQDLVAKAPGGAAPAPGATPAVNIGGSELLQIENLKRLENAPRPVFVDVGLLADMEPGPLKAVDVEGHSILVVNLEGEPYAFRNVCPVDGRSELDGGRLAGSVLVCPWHNCAYDARSGRRADDEPGQQSLAVVPIAVRDGVLKVAATIA